MIQNRATRPSPALDDAIERFRSVAGGGNNPTLADNLRFRLAEALADRADLEPAGSRRPPVARVRGPRLARPGPGGAGPRRLLAPAQGRPVAPAGKTGRGRERDRRRRQVDARPAAARGRRGQGPAVDRAKRYDDAIKSLESSPLEKPVKALWMVRVRLAQLASLPAGAERFSRRVRAVSLDQGAASGDVARAAAGASGPGASALVPDAKQPPDVWEALADAYGAAGEPAKAGAEMVRAADRAAALGQAGRGGRLSAARRRLPVSGRPVSRSRRGLVAGRRRPGRRRPARQGRHAPLPGARPCPGSGLPGASAASYAAALEQQLRDFPADPSTDEARWLLGQLAVAAGDRARAETLWSAIAAGSPRWLDSRLAIAALDRDELDRQQINPDRHQLIELFERADRFLERAIDQAQSEEGKAELLLARARLNLTPSVGKPETARDLCERVSRLPGAPALQYRARLYRLVALVELGRYVEAEREAQSHSSWRTPTEQDALFDAVRLLDQCAATAETDLRQRRFGLVLRLIVEPLVIEHRRKNGPRITTASWRCG